MLLLDKLAREQVVVWKVNGVCTNDSSSALQYPAGIWLQVELKLVSLEVLRAFGFSLSLLGPPNFLVLYFVCAQRSFPSTCLWTSAIEVESGQPCTYSQCLLQIVLFHKLCELIFVRQHHG